MLENLGLMAVAGFCAKVVDEIAERRLAIRAIEPVILAVIYGLSMGWLASQTLLGPLLLALAVASLLSGKIDHPYHMVGAACFALIFISLPLLTFDPWWFALFLVSGLLDELDLGKPKSGVLAVFNQQRLWTPLAVVGAVVMLGAPILFLFAIVCFDIFYRFGGWIVELRYPQAGASPMPGKAKGRRKR